MLIPLYPPPAPAPTLPPDELKRLANEVLDLLQKQAGTSAYIEVYNHVHFQVQRVRQERRTQRARLVGAARPGVVVAKRA